VGAAPLVFKGAGFCFAPMERKRNPLKRFYGRNDLHFVTFSCYRRRQCLGTVRARNRFVKVLDQVRLRFGFELVGYVVMPEHVHLLMSEPEKGNPSRVLQVLKQQVSRALRKRSKENTKQMKLLGGVDALAFWQRRFYDFNVWSEKKLREKLLYMHRNPVERRLVEHPKDWPWSSWSFYAKGEGLIRVDIAKRNAKPAPLNIKGAAPYLGFAD
jgi:putative transposase